MESTILFPSVLSDNLPVAFWVTDLDLQLTWITASPVLESLLAGPGSVRMLGNRKVLDLSYPQHPNVVAHLKARRGEVVKWKTGPNQSLWACVAPLFDKEGATVGLSGAAVDMSELQAERSQRESLEFLVRMVLKNGGYGMAVTDQDGYVVFADDEYCKILNREKSELLGSKGPIAPRAQAELADMKDSPHREGNVSSQGKFRITHTPLRTFDGRTMTCHLARRQSAEDEVTQELGGLYEALFLEASNPMVLLNRDGTIKKANGKFCEILEEKESRVCGTSVYDWLTQESADKVHGLFENKPGELCSGLDIIVTGSLGRRFIMHCEVHMSRERSSGNSHVLLLANSWRSSALRGAPKKLDDLDRKILEMIAQGKQNSEISGSLCISRQGLDYRIKRLRDILGADGRGALVARAYFLGMLCPEQWPPKVSADNLQPCF
ncbi:PAS domain-containing protein [Streptomyces sp. PTY087I2]|uniref:PAS domain-containing protein n=1 Tax=Streptomyces sp. PTY087I2 TaxID=1819298 RepID=UPI0008290AA3|nr:PAS domain-containing protein [Streptomyces sp. PTY087I2]OCC08577.1 PAS fold protein [Streptomyces sp. PTY087I2]